MARNTKPKDPIKDLEEVKEQTEPTTEATDTGDTDVKPVEPTSVTVEFRGQTRVFSKEIHGEDFADLAQTFATKHNGTLV